MNTRSLHDALPICLRVLLSLSALARIEADAIAAGDCFDALLSRRVGSIDELAGIEGVSDRYVSSLLPLAFLAPDIVDAVAAGRQPANLTAHRLIRSMELPIGWGAQRQLLGFS